jgi:hypothetical protein
MLHTLTEKLKVNKFVLALALEFSFYFGFQDYWTEERILDVWGATLSLRLPCGED